MTWQLRHDTPLPGGCSPSLQFVQYSADLVEKESAGAYYIVYERENLYPRLPLDPISRSIRTLTKQKLQQSLYPELGAWVWTAWVDAENDDYVSPRETLRWVESPYAMLYAPFNQT